MSDAINRFSWNARGDKARFVFPDWGLYLPFTMITRGEIPMDFVFDPQAIRKTLCQGQDVVMASIGADAEKKTRERIASVNWQAPEQSIFTQKDGPPVIYAVRWRVDPKAACS